MIYQKFKKTVGVNEEPQILHDQPECPHCGQKPKKQYHKSCSLNEVKCGCNSDWRKSSAHALTEWKIKVGLMERPKSLSHMGTF